MSLPARDPLLATARLIVLLFMALLIAVAGIMLVGLGATLTTERPFVLDRLAATGSALPFYWMIVGACTLILALLVVAFFFMRHLLRIIGSVQKGDPFDLDNADRLRRMAWLTVTGQAILLALAVISAATGGMRFALLAEDAVSAAFGGVLLALVLFILARVFRLGAAMRADLEGTV